MERQNDITEERKDGERFIFRGAWDKVNKV